MVWVDRLSITILVAFMLFLSACSGLASKPQIVVTLSPRQTLVDIPSLLRDADTALGARIFAEHCVRCHGIDGKGQGELVLTGQLPPIPDFTSQTAKRISPEAWYTVVRDGRIDNLMPPWGQSLSPEEIAAVTRYTYEMHEQNVAAETVTGGPPQSTAQSVGLTIHGVVTNGTSGGQQTDDGLVATLYSMTTTSSGTQVRRAPIKNGAFTFADVPSADAYVVGVMYDGIPFMSKTIAPTIGSTTLELPIVLYDKTTDVSQIEIVLLLIEAQQEGDHLLFNQIVQFDNLSHGAFVSAAPSIDGQSVSVFMPLPDGARLVDSSLQSQYIVGSDQHVVYDTQPLLPGERRTLHMAYTLPFDESATITFKAPYPVSNQAEIMLPASVLMLASTQFSAQGTRQSVSGVYSRYLTKPLGSGETLHFEVLKAVSPPNLALPVAIGFSLLGIGLLTFSAVLYVYSYQTIQHPLPQPAVIKTLVQEIATLDIRYKQDEIDEKSYQQQRIALKQQLAALMKEMHLQGKSLEL